jgi:D-glycero-D-manno-heptose 1,7-bisphosphate phosphatase
VTSPRPAVFLDRDGTIIYDAEYIWNPDDIRLLPGAADAIARLNAVRIPVIVITNQSGIARGLLTNQQYEAVRARLDELLAARGAHLDASYFCPHHPAFGTTCECRKPGTLLYRQAAAALGIDLATSTFVGDRWRDVAPAIELGGRGILIAGPSTPPDELRKAQAHAQVAHSLADVVERVVLSRAPLPAARIQRP